MKTHFLHKIFHPQSIAVIGATDRKNSVGQKVFTNLLKSDFKGKIYAVNPKHKKILDQPCYPDVTAISAAIDLAVIVTPAVTVPEIFKQCGAKKIHHAIVISAGFSETGAEGKKLEEEILKVAQQYQIHFIGPNCLGIMRPPISLNATFDKHAALPGNLALVSQSGALIAAITDWANPQQIGFSTIASLGNASNVDFGDVLDYLALDEKTASILLYVEGVHNARQFMSGLRAAARMKPVIVVKGGRHAQGTRAALSHTGALIGGDDVFDAALKRAGAVRVITIEDLFSAAEILSSGYRVEGNRLAIITNGGGVGVLASDRAVDVNVNTPELSKDLIDKLNKILPPHWSHHNPIDILGDATPETYKKVLDTCLQDPNYDGVLTILTPVSTAQPLSAAKQVIEVIEKNHHDPVLTCWMGEEQVKSSWDLFAKYAIPCFSTPEPAIEAFSYLADYHYNQQLLMQVPEPLTEEKQIDFAHAQKIIMNALAKQQTTLTSVESKEILKAYNISISETIVAANVPEAIQAAKKVKYPIVMKINSPDITHKKDVGGVQLDIINDDMLKNTFEEMMTEVKKIKPDAKILGVTIEHMYKNPYDRELMAGVIRDPVFGPVISFGTGGSLVEVFKDRAIALPPLNAFIAKQLINKTLIVKALGNFRGMPPVNLELIENVLLNISQMICDLPQIKEMDINPLLANDKEIVAVDARIIVENHVTKNISYEHMAIHPYPSNLISQWQMDDGVNVTIRPIRPEDAKLEQAAFAKLSPQTRYLRFQENIQELTHAMLVRFTQIDYDREMALVAVVNNEIVGVARYVTNPDKESCEFAIVIADAWQQKGLGAHLMKCLIDIAKSKGLKMIEGEILAENTHMLELMKNLGFAVHDVPNDDRIKIARKCF